MFLCGYNEDILALLYYEKSCLHRVAFTLNDADIRMCFFKLCILVSVSFEHIHHECTPLIQWSRIAVLFSRSSVDGAGAHARNVIV